MPPSSRSAAALLSTEKAPGHDRDGRSRDQLRRPRRGELLLGLILGAATILLVRRRA
jgi:hypothetical protein